MKWQTTEETIFEKLNFFKYIITTFLSLRWPKMMLIYQMTMNVKLQKNSKVRLIFYLSSDVKKMWTVFRLMIFFLIRLNLNSDPAIRTFEQNRIRIFREIKFSVLLHASVQNSCESSKIFVSIFRIWNDARLSEKKMNQQFKTVQCGQMKKNLFLL